MNTDANTEKSFLLIFADGTEIRTFQTDRDAAQMRAFKYEAQMLSRCVNIVED